MRHLPGIAATTTLLALAGCQSLAYREAARSLRVDPQPMDHGLDALALPSGLRLAVFQVPGQRDLTLSLALGGGASDEPEGKAGLAEVAASAALVAPRFAGGASLLEQLHAAGALLDTSLAPDETTLSVRFRPAFQAAVLSAVGAFLDDPAAGVDEEAVRRAGRAVASALERGSDGPEAQIRRLALEGTPLGHGAPTAAGALALTATEVRAFLRASYVLPRAVLWLSTGGDAEQVARAVVAALPQRVAGDAARPVLPEAGYSAEPPPARTPVREVALTGGTRPRLLLAWRGPGYRFSPAADRAGGDLRARLAARAAQPDLTDKVRSVGSGLVSYDRTSLLLIDVILERPEDAEPVRRALLETSRQGAETLGRPSPAAEALLRREIRLERERQAAYGWMGPVGRLVRATGSADVPAWLDLNEASQFGPSHRAWYDAWIAPGPTVVATVTPAPDAGGAIVGEEEAVAAPPTPSGAARVWATAPDPMAAAVPGPEALDRLLEPAGLGAVRRERLPSGVELLALRRESAPFALVHVMLPGGAAGAGEVLAARRALAGAHARLRAEGCGLAPEARLDADGVVLRLSGPVPWLPAVAEAVACWSQPLAAPRALLPTPDEALPWQAFEAALTGGPLPGLVGGKAWSEAYLRRVGQTEGAVAVVAGDVDPAAALAQLRASMGHFPARRPAGPAPLPSPFPTARRILLEDVPGAKQASASIFLRMPQQEPALPASRWILSALLRGLAERTFGPSGFEVGSAWKGHGRTEVEWLRLSGPPGLLPAAAADLLQTLGRLRDQGPSTIEADAARWRAARGLAYWPDAAPGAAGLLAWLTAAGLPPEAWDGLAAEFRKVDAPALRALLRRSGVGLESIVVRGDAALLVPLLRREGLEPEVLAPPAKDAKAAQN